MIKFASFSLSFCGFLLLAAVAEATYTPCEDCTDRANASTLTRIELRLYTGQSSDEYTTVVVDNAVDLLTELDSSKPTVLYVPGWTEDPTSTSVQTVLAAYFTRQDHNILVADYSEIANTEWEYAAGSADGVGYTLATALDELVTQGLDSEYLHIVGHSLGGQVSGFIGRYVNFTLPRITGLDPAGPSFTESDEHLSATDATFVDIIHTNPGYLGIAYAAGTVDFYPNGATPPQPGCEDDSFLLAVACSHYRSWMYYAESLVNEASFIGVACESESEFESGACSSAETLVMGYATPTTASGIFTLQTNSEYPYGQGSEGTTYQESS